MLTWVQISACLVGAWLLNRERESNGETETQKTVATTDQNGPVQTAAETEVENEISGDSEGNRVDGINQSGRKHRGKQSRMATQSDREGSVDDAENGDSVSSRTRDDLRGEPTTMAETDSETATVEE